MLDPETPFIGRLVYAVVYLFFDDRTQDVLTSFFFANFMVFVIMSMQLTRAVCLSLIYRAKVTRHGAFASYNWRD